MSTSLREALKRAAVALDQAAANALEADPLGALVLESERDKALEALKETYPDVKVTFTCPACGQGNEASVQDAIVIDVTTEHIGTGEYVGAVEAVSVYCSGCKISTEVEYK